MSSRSRVTGDTRFDRVEEIARAAKDIPAVAELSRGRRLLVVGSSWPEDEAILLPYFNEEAPADFALVLAPHEIHEEHLRAIESGLKRPSIRLSEYDEAKGYLRAQPASSSTASACSPRSTATARGLM